MREGDKVQCIFCMVIIGEFEMGDDITADHRKFSPNCPFMMEYNVGNVPINPEEDSSQLGVPSPHDTVARYQFEMRMFSDYERRLGRNRPLLRNMHLGVKINIFSFRLLLVFE